MSANGNGAISFEGDDKILANLNKLGDNAGDLLEAAIQEGMEPIVEDANRRAPTPAVRVKITRKHGVIEGRIGFTKDKWYYRFFETGATPHEIKGPLMIFEGREATVITRHVQNAGGLPANPILRPALDGQKEEALRRILNRLMRGVSSEGGSD